MLRYLLLLLFIVPLAAFAQVTDLEKKAQLDTLFARLERNNMSMGSLSIYKDGMPFYTKTYGMANYKNKTALPANGVKTMYRVGSLTKIFTAFLVMKFAEEGKISLDQKINTWFPGLVNADKISVESLLSHKSLLPVYTRVDDLEKIRKVKTEAQLVNLVNKQETSADTAAVKYNNLNYILLGLILEKIEHKPYNEILKERMAADIGVHAYGIYHLLDYTKNEANSFHRETTKWEEDYEISEAVLSDGSGFLVSNAESMTRFMVDLFDGKLLKKESLEKMLPQKTVFGYGLMKTNLYSHKGFGHTGRIEGFTSATGYFPNEKTGMSFLQNGTVYPLNDIFIIIGSIMLGEKYSFPDFARLNLADSSLNMFTGTYENTEEGYKVIVDHKNGELRLRLAKGSGLFNKMILPVYALSPNRLFNSSQGAIFDFANEKNNLFTKCDMRINSAKLTMIRSN